MPFNARILEMLLNACEVDTALWGAGESKTVENFLYEIMEGESYLKIDGLSVTRVLEIVTMHILDPFNPGRGCLVEWEQHLPDGRRRSRRQKPAGKIKRGESSHQALIREAKEELQIDLEEYAASFLKTETENRQSKSYPGIPCLYIIHHFKIIVPARSPLLQDEFSVTENDGTIQKFRWIQ